MAVLATALQDPAYSSLSDYDAAELMNSLTGPFAGTIQLTRLDAKDMQKAITGTEYLALNAGQRDLWGAIINLGEVPTDDTEIRGQLNAIFAAGTTSRANLLALLSRTGSHSEVLFGQEVYVDWSNVSAARALQ